MSTNENFFEKIWDSIKSIFEKAESEAKIIAHVADNLTNAIKNFEATPTIQAIESTLEAVFPSTIPLVNAFHLWFPKIAGIISNVKTEVDKSDEAQYHDLIAYLSTLKTSDPTLYAGALNTINGVITKWISDNQGIIVTVPQALATPQVVHSLN